MFAARYSAQGVDDFTKFIHLAATTIFLNLQDGAGYT
jgi:hypothetical protein